MKPIKMFGLAALAALMAMAFVGASSAMAESTVLCDRDPGTGSPQACPAPSMAEELAVPAESPLVTHVHETSVGKAKLLSSSTVECNALFLSTVNAEGKPTGVGALGTPQVIKGTFSYSSCTSGCSVNEENGPAEILVLKTAHETATVTGEGLVHVNCFGFINCRYNGTGLLGTGKGPLLGKLILNENKEFVLENPNGEVTISGQVVEFESGAFCPEGASLDITTTPLSATYITN